MDVVLQFVLIGAAAIAAFAFKSPQTRKRLAPAVCIPTFLLFAYTAITDPSTRYTSLLFAALSVGLLIQSSTSGGEIPRPESGSK